MKVFPGKLYPPNRGGGVLVERIEAVNGGGGTSDDGPGLE